MQFHLTQEKVARSKARFKVLNCGRGWGKTQYAVEEAGHKALAKKGRRILYIAPTIQQARDIAWERFKERYRPITYKAKESPSLELTVHTVDGGLSTIVLRGWEAVETLRGQEFDYIVIDEVASMRNFWVGWQEVLLPTLRISRGGVLFISTPKGFNHFYDLFNTVGKNWESFKFTSYDNPYIKEEEIEEARQSSTEDKFAQEYLADFRKMEGLVYKEFDRTKHTFDDKHHVPEPVEVLGGMDFGFTNPTSILKVQRDRDNHYWVTTEWYKSGKTTAEIIEVAKSMRINIFYPDPAEPDRILEMQNAGLNVREVSKDVVNGINSVRELFKQNRIHISQDCKNLITELETYRYPDRKPDKNEPELPVKENDHACFVAGTLVNGKPIESIGYQTGVYDVFTYKVAGKELTCTTNHPILTNRGLIDIDTLRYNDVIWHTKTLLFTTPSSGLDFQTLLRGLTGTTIYALQRTRTARERDYIDIHGKNTTEISQMENIYITLMATPQIMKLVILSVLTLLNTTRYILQKKSERFVAKTLRKPLSVLLSGLKQKKENKEEERLANKTASTSRMLQYIQRRATCVIENILQNTQTKVDSATSTVVQKHYVGQEPVYNLRTKSGMYNANGILVSNCDALRYVLYMQDPSPEVDDDWDYGLYE